MIELTRVAATQLRELRSSAPDRQVLRVYVAGRSCCGVRYGLALDEAPSESDTVAEREGISVAVDPASLPFVEGATIDFVDSPEGAGFTVRNPSFEGGGCACGNR